MKLTGENHIGYMRSSKGSHTFRTFNPVLDKPNDIYFHEATSEEVSLSVELAFQSFATYRKTPGIQRSAFLNAIADLLDTHSQELIQVYSQESGLPLERGKNELDRTILQLRTFANLIADDKWKREVKTVFQENESVHINYTKTLIPLGPIVVFGASNFPFAYSTVGGDTAAALAAGCPVIVKAHPLHAGTSELVAELLIEAAKKSNMPEGVFSHLHAENFEVGRQLVSHPKIKAVGFTGSVQGGRALMDLAAARNEPIPVFAEMGSLNPVIFLKQGLNSRPQYWASLYASSVATDSGQFCTKPGLLFIPSDEIDRFTKLLNEEFSNKPETPFLHPSIENKYVKNKTKISSDVIKKSTKNYVFPMIYRTNAKDFLERKELKEEVFGPFSVCIEYSSEDELRLCLDSISGQLTASIIASEHELNEHTELLDLLTQKAGRIIINGAPTGVRVIDAMQHGGPYPSSSDSRFTAVGPDSIYRFVRPITFQQITGHIQSK